MSSIQTALENYFDAAYSLGIVAQRATVRDFSKFGPKLEEQKKLILTLKTGVKRILERLKSRYMSPDDSDRDSIDTNSDYHEYWNPEDDSSEVLDECQKNVEISIAEEKKAIEYIEIATSCLEAAENSIISTSLLSEAKYLFRQATFCSYEIESCARDNRDYYEEFKEQMSLSSSGYVSDFLDVSSVESESED